MVSKFQSVQSVSVALTAKTQPQSTIIPKVLGTILGFKIQMSMGSTTGTTSAVSIDNALLSFKISDSNHVPILDVLGTDLANLAYLLDPLGYKVSVPNSSTSATEAATMILNLPVSLANQPVYIDSTLNTLTAGAGAGTTAATFTLAVGVFYDDSQAASCLQTQRVSKVSNVSVSTGVNNLAAKLGQGLNVNKLAFTIGTDGNMTSFTWEHAGVIEIEQEDNDTSTALDDAFNLSGHVSGLFNVRMTPATVTSATTFNITASASDTVNIYQFYT